MNDRWFTFAGPPRRLRALVVIATSLLWLPACRDRPRETESLRTQLGKAEESQDAAAVAELSRRLLEFEPGADDLREKLVRALLSTGRLEQAAESLDSWERRPPPHPAVVDQLRGDLAFARHHDTEAIAHWRRYLVAKPGDATPLDWMAQAALRSGDWPGAERILSEALAIESRPGWFTRRAQALLFQRKWDAAFADIARAGDLDPSHPDVKEWIARLELLKQSIPELRLLDEQIATAPLGLDLLLERAELLCKAGQLELALEDARRALVVEPASVRARLQTGEVLLELGRQDEAAMLRVNATQPHSPLPYSTLLAIGEIDAQIAANPGDPSALAGRAALLCDARQFLLALDDAETAIGTDPRNVLALRAGGRALLSLGRTSEAIVRFTRATLHAQDDSAAWLDRARAEMATANHPAAIASLTRSLVLRETVEALVLREQSFRATGQSIDADLDIIRIRQLGGGGK